MGGSTSALRSSKGVTYDGTKVSECLFCKLVAARAPVDRLYLDGVCCAFLPRRSDAAGHVLVVPRRHVKNLSAVEPADAELLEHMRAVGGEVLARAADRPARSGAVAADGSLVDVDAGLLARERRLALACKCPDFGPAMDAALQPSPPAGSADLPRRSGRAGGSAPACPVDAEFAFHAPPYNSIDHLHLHCLVPPYASPCTMLSHWAGARWSPTLEQVVERLRRESKL